MPGAVAANAEQQYACKCLNVRIRPTPAPTVAADLIKDPDFVQVHVGEEGITVAHPQVTVRTRTRAVPIPGTSRCSRYTTITCLLCDLLVYRVFQTFPKDVDGKDGPLLPSEDWVERDIMKSMSGWIEVHKDCLANEAVTEALSSSQYSPGFSLRLPLAGPTEPMFERPPSHTSHSPEREPYLSRLKPLFLPPPYTPSHPVFAHLSSLATQQSDATRGEAEQYIADLVNKKIAEIERSDENLRQDVEKLWKKFLEGLDKVQPSQTSLTRSRTSTSRERSFVNGVNDSPYGTPVAIRDFVPGPVSIRRTSPPASAQMSGISASLATTSFHHPRARASSAMHDTSVHGALQEPTDSTSSQSGSTTVVLPPSSEGTNILKFRRNINDTINTAASFRYFVNFEADMARRRAALAAQSAEVGANAQRDASSTSLPATTSATTRDRSPATAEDAKPKEPNDETQLGETAEPSRGRDKSPKGKRKVKFDIQPAVVTIKREINAEKQEEEARQNQDPRGTLSPHSLKLPSQWRPFAEMIFELEDLDQEAQDAGPSLHLVEQPFVPRRPKRTRPFSVGSLPVTFSALRPASLPAPSNIRPIRNFSHSYAASARSEDEPLVKPYSVDDIETVHEEDESDDIRNAVLLRLVAANTPSHRGAWEPGSKAWRMFMNKNDARRAILGNHIPEDEHGEVLDATYDDEDEEDENDTDSFTPIVGSLPIPIKLARPPRQVLSLASYQPQTAAAQQAAASTVPTPRRKLSSAALRRAVYAERDRSRSLDPGALDFAEEDEEEEEDEEDEESEQPATGEPQNAAVAVEAGGRGRKRALKILQTRSEVPDAGMWRSLAS